MKMNNTYLRTAGAVGVMLVALSVEADQNRKGSSTSIDVADAPSLLTPAKHKAVPSAAAPHSAAAAPEVLEMGKVEVVTERYPDGKIKLEREVGQDAAGNYINQGLYKQYAHSGELVKAGEFLNGKRQGKWTQHLAKDEGHLFSASQDKQWSGPFTSEATFQDGHLHGTWTIKDSRGQNIIQWSFDSGTRAGTWTWWHANGQKHLEATYLNGVLNGEVFEWSPDGKIVSQNSYIDGKCVVKKVGWYTLGQKRYEGTYLCASNMPEATYDWSNTKIATSASAPAGPDLQHGSWTEWYPGGNKKTEALYDRGVAVGKIIWWYENGQQQAEGEYENGVKSGTWTTWHPNGMRQSLAEFKAGKPVTKELEWSAEGKLVESHAAQTPSISQATKRTSKTR